MRSITSRLYQFVFVLERIIIKHISRLGGMIAQDTLPMMSANVNNHCACFVNVLNKHDVLYMKSISHNIRGNLHGFQDLTHIT